MRTLAVIPARLGATRLPRKPLRLLAGLPLVGGPVVTIRHVLGSAGVGTLPDLEQNIALRVTFAFVRVEVVVDPARDEVKTGVGLAFSR